MTLNEIRTKWTVQADELERLGALVSAGTLCRALLEDLDSLSDNGTEDPAENVLSMREASEHSGYSTDHLARLVKQGKLRTLRSAGSRGRYAFRRGDLPQKPGRPHTSDAGVHDLASRLLGGKERRHG